MLPQMRAESSRSEECQAQRVSLHSLTLVMASAIAVAILASASVLYVVFQRIHLENLYALSQDQLSKTDQAVELLTSLGSSLASQVFHDQYVSRLIFQDGVSPSTMSVALQQLDSYRQSNRFVDSIYVYNRGSDTVYVSSESVDNWMQSVDRFASHDSGFASLIATLHEIGRHTPIPRSFSVTYPYPAVKDVYTFIYFQGRAERTAPAAVVAVNVSAVWLQQLLAADAEGGIQQLIVDDRGLALLPGTNHRLLTDLSHTAAVTRVLSAERLTGYVVYRDGGEEMVVTFSRDASRGWTYAQIIPNALFKRSLRTMRLRAVAIAALVLVVGVLAGAVASRRLYVPIERLVDRVSDLEHLKSDYDGLAAARLLRSLLQGAGSEDPGEIRQSMAQCHLPIDFDAGFFVVCARSASNRGSLVVSGDHDFGSTNAEIAARLGEALGQRELSIAVDMGQGETCVVAQLGDETPNRDTVRSRLQGSIDGVGRQCGIVLTVAVDWRRGSIDLLAPAYRMTHETLAYSFYVGVGRVLFPSDVSRMSAGYVYPVRAERKVVRALLSGDLEGTLAGYHDLMKGAATYTLPVFTMASARLSATVSSVVERVRSAHRHTSIAAVDARNATPAGYETIDEMHAYFEQLFRAIVDAVDESGLNKHKELVGRIQRYIAQNFSRYDLSLTMLSDHFGLSPGHLGRVFRDLTMTSIVDYIGEFRLSRACEQLANGKEPIRNIARQVGYTSSSYFDRVFKRVYGMTPGQYREKHRSHAAPFDDPAVATERS